MNQEPEEDVVRERVKEKLFGSLRRPLATGNHPIRTEELREPLPDDDYALHFFCSGCGMVLPVLKSAVRAIAGAELPDYSGHYIATERCNICDVGFIHAHLEELPAAS